MTKQDIEAAFGAYLATLFSNVAAQIAEGTPAAEAVRHFQHGYMIGKNLRDQLLSITAEQG